MWRQMKTRTQDDVLTLRDEYADLLQDKLAELGPLRRTPKSMPGLHPAERRDTEQRVRAA